MLKMVVEKGLTLCCIGRSETGEAASSTAKLGQTKTAGFELQDSRKTRCLRQEKKVKVSVAGRWKAITTVKV